MSVYKSRRKDAAAEFISHARELRKVTMRVVKRFPTSYRWIITNNLLELACEIYTDCLKANAIFVHKDMSQHDFDLRHRYLTMAASSAEALLGEITFSYELVDDGNNYFKSRAEYDDVFRRWTEQGNTALKRIRALLESDKQRYASYQKKKMEEAKKKAEEEAAKKRGEAAVKK